MREPNSKGSGKASQIVDFVEHYPINSQLMDERRSFPPGLIPDSAAAGLFGLQVAEEYGGQDLTHSDPVWVTKNLASRDCNAVSSLSTVASRARPSATRVVLIPESIPELSAIP